MRITVERKEEVSQKGHWEFKDGSRVHAIEPSNDQGKLSHETNRADNEESSFIMASKKFSKDMNPVIPSSRKIVKVSLFTKRHHRMFWDSNY